MKKLMWKLKWSGIWGSDSDFKDPNRATFECLWHGRRFKESLFVQLKSRFYVKSEQIFSKRGKPFGDLDNISNSVIKSTF